MKKLALLLTLALVISCTAENEPPARPNSAQVDPIVVEGELIVLIDQTVDIDRLRDEWRRWGASIDLRGPRKDGLLIVSFPENSDIDALAASIKRTEGVLEVEANLKRRTISPD